MEPFPPSEGKQYILVVVDYVSKWVEAISTRTNDHRVVNKFIVNNIFSRFGCPRARHGRFVRIVRTCAICAFCSLLRTEHSQNRT